MTALFVGHNCTDITIVSDVMPTGNNKAEGSDYAFGVGGNAAVASFTAAKLGVRTDFVTQVANDRLGDIFLKRAAKLGIRIYPLTVKRSSIGLAMPNGKHRAIVSCKDSEILSSYPLINVKDYRVVHYDGYFDDYTVDIVKNAHEAGVLTSLDGGRMRAVTEELLPLTHVGVMSEDFAEELGKTPGETLKYLAEKGVGLPAVTLGDEGLVYLENGIEKHIKAFPVANVIDSTGAGDIFHGAYVASYLNGYGSTWEEHFKFAAAASALSVQVLGAENSIPHLKDIQQLLTNF